MILDITQTETRNDRAFAWEQEYDRSRACAGLDPAWLNPHCNAAIGPAGDLFEAAGEAERLAWEAMLAGRIRYSGRLGWAERNLLERWLFYRRCMRLQSNQKGARKLVRNAIGLYRELLRQQRSGIFGRLDGDAA